MEHVWDYPRPPAVVACERRVRIQLAGEQIVDSANALRVLETSHPPTIYVPSVDVRTDRLAPSASRSTWCEFKGEAHYLRPVDSPSSAPAVAWTYPSPASGYEALAGHIAFYPGRVDRAWLDEERVQAQLGDFYGGWITVDVVGPFKGGAGTRGW